MFVAGRTTGFPDARNSGSFEGKRKSLNHSSRRLHESVGQREELPHAFRDYEAELMDCAFDAQLVAPRHVDVIPARPHERDRQTGPAKSADGEIQAANLGQVRVVDVARVREDELLGGDPERVAELRHVVAVREHRFVEAGPDDDAGRRRRLEGEERVEHRGEARRRRRGTPASGRGASGAPSPACR